MPPKENEQKWTNNICPVCGKEYKYLDKGWKQQTCGSFDCVTKYYAYGSDFKQKETVYNKEDSIKQ